MAEIDIDAVCSEPFLMVKGLTSVGQDWITDNCTEDWCWDGDTLFVEHRYGPGLLLGAHNDGLTVRLDGQVADAPR